MGKAALLVLLGVFGALHRTRLVVRFAQKATGFWRLVVLELAVMGFAMGLGTALAMTPLPLSDEPFVHPLQLSFSREIHFHQSSRMRLGSLSGTLTLFGQRSWFLG